MLHDAGLRINSIEARTAGTTVTAAAPTPAWAYITKIRASRANGAYHSATTPVIRPRRAFPWFAGLHATLNFALDLPDEFEYAPRVAGNVKVRPIKVLELDDASRWQVWKAGVRELEYSLDGRLGG